VRWRKERERERGDKQIKEGKKRTNDIGKKDGKTKRGEKQHYIKLSKKKYRIRNERKPRQKQVRTKHIKRREKQKKRV
jgi:hypothetical protein